MDTLNIVISGNSPEAFDFLAKLSESRHQISMNEIPNNQTIDLLIIFDTFNLTLKKSMNDKTICFCFNPSLSLDLCNLYSCHFEEPKNGEMQSYQSFIIDIEVHSMNRKFSQIYGILTSIGYEIKFSETENPVFEPILAASALHQSTTESPQEKIVLRDASKTTFHLILALDCTGSMSSAINNIKKSLIKIVSVINSEFKNIIISFYAFRDYCDSQIIRKTLFESNCDNIIKAIGMEEAYGGGDEPEAHKTCLAEIKDDIQKKKEEMTNVCFFITDAPPHIVDHSSTYKIEARYLKAHNLDFATDWIKLANYLNNDGIQVFTFLTGIYSHVSLPIMSSLTHGLSFLIPNNHSVFEVQMISIVSNLIDNTSAKPVQGIKMILPAIDPTNLTKEKEMDGTSTKVVTDVEEIQSALIEKGQLMRLKPSDRGAKRATISSSELVETGIIAIKALKALYKIIKGDSSSYSFFDENPKFKIFSDQLKEANPNPDWLKDSSISCICSLMTIPDSFESLEEIDENDETLTKDITRIVETLGNFVIGYPFLFQLNEDGKFNMQDAWPIIFKDASTAYTISITSLYHILTSKPKADESNKMINRFKDFVASNERSGIVPICCDELTKFALNILDVTKWLDALVSYGLHRHIEPLPSITRAACCAFITTISKQAMLSSKSMISESQHEALQNVTNTLDAMISQGCQSMTNELRKSIENKQISFNAFSPQEPCNCSGINKILNSFFQLRKLIENCEHNFMVKFFYQGIHEYIGILQQFIPENNKKELFDALFDNIEIDVENVTEQNPLECNDSSKFTNFVYHLIEPHKICKSSIFLFKVVWNLLRKDEFEEPSQLMITASLAQAITIQSRSFKYQKATNENENDENEDEGEKYEIKPIFATQDPIEILRTSCFLHFKQVNAESILTLKENRKNYLINEAIEKILIPFRNCDFDEFFSALLSGFSLDWMEEPFKLTMVHAQEIFTKIVDCVKRIEPNGHHFYESVLYVLALGKDKNEHKWMVGSYQNKDVVNSYIEQFLNGDPQVLKYYAANCSRPQPNRHAHHAVFCPYQEVYTTEYARSRIICNIAPFYFIPELPKKVKPISNYIILHLSQKRGAPEIGDIYCLAEEIKYEMLKLENK